MQRLEKEFSEDRLTVVWVGIQDKPEKLKAFAERHGIGRLGYDERNLVSRSYGVTYGAGLLFIDAKGMVKKRVAKGVPEGVLRENIKAITGRI